MRLGDLAAQREADPGARRLRREERHEQVGVSGRPGPSSSTVTWTRRRLAPVDPDPAAGLERRVDGVADDVDQQLLELIGIGVDLDVAGRLDRDRQAVLELGDPVGERRDRTGAAAASGSRASCA